MYSSEIRVKSVEAGTFVISQELGDQMMIPPESDEFVVSAHCSSDCTQQVFPDEGITVFYNFFHSSRFGRKMKLRHFRGAQELEWIDLDSNFDAEYQQSRALFMKKIQKGDQITLECTYNTTSHLDKKATVGGLSLHDELCEAVLYYYPKGPYFKCGSYQILEEHMTLLGFSNFTTKSSPIPGGLPRVDKILEPSDLAGEYIDSISRKVDWTEEFRDKYQQEKQYGEQVGFCKGEAEHSGTVKYPEDMKPYIPKDLCEDGGSSSTTNNHEPGNGSGGEGNQFMGKSRCKMTISLIALVMLGLN